VDIATGARTLVGDPQIIGSAHATWSPNGEFVAFASPGPNRTIVVRRADGTGEEQVLTPEQGAGSLVLSDWSQDGRYLLYYRSADGTPPHLDIWYIERTEDGDWSEPQPFLEQPGEQTAPTLSPDGRYVAYASDESGRSEIYVRPFPQGAQRWTVSANGGGRPRWSRDGTELFYVEGDTLMAVEVSIDGEFSRGGTTPLFSHPTLTAGPSTVAPVMYNVSEDGQRILLAQPDLGEDEAEPPGITIVENWYQEFRDRQ
jgi:Tol biopolymer transport system component